MSDVANVPFVRPGLRAAYVAISRVALVTMLLAGLVNLIIGPRAPVIFVLALFQLGFAWLVLVLADSHPPVEPPFFVGRHGPLFAVWMVSTRILGWWLSVLVPVFLCFSAAGFLVSAIVISVVVTRTL
jgi:hypothetical protein